MKSEKRSKNSQQRNAPVFFLDRNLGAVKLADALRPAGFSLVTHQDVYGPGGMNISDPEVIAHCGRHKRILLTADGDLEYTYAAEIVRAKVGVFILSNNTDGPGKWGPRLVVAKEGILRELGRRRKPFAARVSVQSEITQVRMYYRKRSRVIRLAPRRTGG